MSDFNKQFKEIMGKQPTQNREGLGVCERDSLFVQIHTLAIHLFIEIKTF
jgi:hypothetical protein